MPELNILPPTEKKDLSLERFYRWLVFYGNALIAIFLAFTALLFLIWFFILIQLKSYTANLEKTKTSFHGQDIENQQKSVDELNARLEKIAAIQNNHRFYSPLLIHLATIVPAGARLDAMIINEQNQVIISGYAPQRNHLLLLKETLGKSPFFEKINNPLSNLTKQTEINFSFRFNIKPTALKQL